MSQNIMYLDCQSGISGDMVLGALLDAGLSLDILQNALSALPIQGYQLQLNSIYDRGIAGLRIEVVLIEQKLSFHHLADIVALLAVSALPMPVCDTALAIFRCLAEAEAHIQGLSIENAHLHSVETIGTLIDIVGVAVGLDALNIAQVYASALPLTNGHIQMAQGILPVPTPVTLEMLRRVGAPWKSSPIDGELVTSTGAAILAALARFETPPLVIEHIGYGFGQKQPGGSNCLRLCLGSAQQKYDRSGEEADIDWVAVIESHIDNMSGELLGGLMERLFTAGALDVSYTPLQMKKNRPATLVTVICPPEEGERFAMLLLRETSTLGVRIQQVKRLKAQRSQVHIDTSFGAMQVKVKRLGQRLVSATPEYEECQRIATSQNLPLSDVYELVRQAIQSAIIRE